MTTHETTVEYDHNRQYPYKWVPSCSCGELFWDYASERAAREIAVLHEHRARQERRAGCEWCRDDGAEDAQWPEKLCDAHAAEYDGVSIA